MQKRRVATGTKPTKRWLLVELIAGRRGRGGRGRFVFWTFGGEGEALEWRGSPVDLPEQDRRRLIALVNQAVDTHARVRARARRCWDPVGHPWTTREARDTWELQSAEKIVRQATGGSRHA